MKFKFLSQEEEFIAEKIVDAAFKVHKQLGPGLLERVYKVCFCHELSKRDVKYKRQVDLPISYDGMIIRQFDACLRYDTVDRLNGLSIPTLIMTGDDDPLVPPENSYILKELIPGAELVVFPGGRHCIIIEKAGEFNNKTVEFFKANS